MQFLGRAVRSTRAGLLILATSAMLRAWSYAPWQVDQQRNPVHWLESLTTPMVWGGVWAVIAFMLGVAIFLPQAHPRGRGIGRLHACRVVYVFCVADADRGVS